MTNWPNIQEYRNFEAKFFDHLERKNLVDSGGESEGEETVGIGNATKNKTDLEEVINTQRTSAEPKTVRCVIRKNFEETFKKLDRGDGVTLNPECPRSKVQETTATVQSIVDKIRLQNHLKWKRQKKEEYLQRKEAERIEQEKRREEEARKEILKKQKEKEREEKIREWQEQKAREKEEKKQEKMVMKVLEEELKEVTPTVGKEKLLEEWVKLKNRQKKMEEEKKAELLKKEEETRAMRQNLAEISYRQWKERVKGRMMTLPKNGYQIFGPKPVPVVKEDWNHNFTSNSPRDHVIALGNTRSTTNTSFTFRSGLNEDLASVNRSPSVFHLKTTRRGGNGSEGNEMAGKINGQMPLKEIQPGTVGVKKQWNKNWKSGCEGEKFLSHFVPQSFRNKSETNLFSKNGESLDEQHLLDYLSHLMPSAEGSQNPVIKPGNELLGTQILPNKKKIDLFLNTHSSNAEEENFEEKPSEKRASETSEVKPNRDKKREAAGKGVSKVKNRSVSNIRNNAKSDALTTQNETKGVNATGNATKKSVECPKIKEKFCRRSKSYDKPAKKFSQEREKVKGCSSSRSVAKVKGNEDEAFKAKSKTTNPKRRSRRPTKPVTPENTKTSKKQSDSDLKNKKKAKKKSAFSSKSLIFSNSPYCSNRNQSKSLDKTRASRRKVGESKGGDGAGAGAGAGAGVSRTTPTGKA